MAQRWHCAYPEEQTTVGRVVPPRPYRNKFTTADVWRVFKIAQRLKEMGHVSRFGIRHINQISCPVQN